MSNSTTWNGTSILSRVSLKRAPRLRGLSRGGSNTALVFGGLGFLLGLIVGLPILGWSVWPLRISNAAPSDMAAAYQQQYIAMAADSYSLNGDADLARARLQSFKPEEAAAIIGALETAMSNSTPVEAKRLERLRQDLALEAGSQPLSAATPASRSITQQGTQAGSVAAEVGRNRPLAVMLLGAAVLLLAGGGVWAYRRGTLSAMPDLSSTMARLRSLRLPSLPHLRVSRARIFANNATPAGPAQSSPARPVANSATVAEADDELSLDEALSLLAEEHESDESAAQVAPQPNALAEPQGEVLGTFVATYRYGSNELFDTSYSIEGRDQEFLGECGLGVAETVGEASPERACAMEIWLFDKSDIRTTTKLIVSEYAMQNASVRDGMASRGDMVKAQAGQKVLLETASLALTAEVMDLKYADSPDAPPRSYFEEMTLELTARRK